MDFCKYPSKKICQYGLIIKTTISLGLLFLVYNNVTSSLSKMIMTDNTALIQSSNNGGFNKKGVQVEQKTRGTVVGKNDADRTKERERNFSHDSTPCTHMYKIIGQKSIKKSRRNIFFVETSCGTKKLSGERKKWRSEDGLVLDGRQCCAIESTARLNPEYNVYIFHTCKIRKAFYELSSNHVRELLDNYRNVYVVKVNMDRLLKNTPINKVWVDGGFENSKYPVEHLSDAIRLLILWNFGGTYLDLDVISLRPLTSLKSNFAGFESDMAIANGVLNFEPSGFAHDLLTLCLNNFRDGFDGTSWAHNGPNLLTKSLLQFCNLTKVEQLKKRRCSGFHLYPPKVFYPIQYPDWKSFLNERKTQQIMKLIENSTLVHMWNRLSHNSYIPYGSKKAFSLIADKYCPKVYHEVGPSFM